MPFLYQLRDLTSSSSVHSDAPDSVISLSWAFLIIPCIFLAGVFLWIAINFSQPSEFPEDDGLAVNGDRDDQDDNDVGSDEKDQLLDSFQTSQSHSGLHNGSTQSQSTWKINGRYSSTSRGGSIYSSYPDASGHSPASSPKSKRASMSQDTKHAKVVGSKAAKVLTLNKDRMLHDLERLDPIDREELQRSSSRASSIRKSD